MRDLMRLYRVLFSLVSLLAFTGGVAQALPAQTATPITGEVQAITLTSPGNVWSGGTMTVGGQVVILPSNLLINLPNDYQSLQQLFANAPPACQATGESGLAKGDRCNDRATGAMVSILANRTSSGNIIAGQVDLTRANESVQGTITYINTAGGYFRVNGVSGDPNTGAMVRVNDPPVGPAGGRHTVQSGPGCAPGNTLNCSPDTRFRIDPDNYTFCYITGYPACIPTTAPGVDDPNCPIANRPPIANITNSNPFAAPPVAADSRHQAPLQLGDTVKADGFFTTVAGTTFLSAASVRVMVDLTTRTIDPNTAAPDPTQPNYLIINESGWDGPAYPAGRVRGRLLTNSTIHDSEIDFYSIHYDPVNNAPHERPLYTTRFNKQFGVVVFNQPTGVSDSQIRYDFFPGAPGTPGSKVGGGNAGADQQPCASFWGTEPKATGVPATDTTPGNLTSIGVNVSSFCPDPTGMGLVDNFNLMVPIFREVMARSTRSEIPVGVAGHVTGVALDIHGRPAQSGFYKLPTVIAYGAFEDINLGMGQFPHQFSGNPFLLDRRLSPNGCVGACEQAQQPLTPFPFEGIDPRLVAPTFGVVAPPATATVLPTPDRMLTFMTAAGSMTGILPWSAAALNPPAFPILATPALSFLPPFADEDDASTRAGVPVIIPVLANDVSLIGGLDVTTVQIASQPSSGAVQVNPNGTITYTPTPTATGIITFTYTVANTFGSVSLPGTVTVTILTPPVAVNDTASVPAGGTLAINVAANDVGGSNVVNLASVAVTTAPSCGNLVNQLDGMVLYTAPATVPAGGVCTFRYSVSDVSVPPLTSNAATVTVTITPALSTVAVPDFAATTVGAPVVIPVLANDNAAGSTLNPASVSAGAASGGSAAANLDGTITYTPAAVGIYTFSYTVRNNAVPPTTSNAATVTVTVTTPVPTGTLSINGGATFATSPTLNLALAASSLNGAVTQMQFSTDGTTFSALEPFAATKALTIPAGDGARTVTVRFTDIAGQVSANVSASIILDTTLPVAGPLVINGGAAQAINSVVNLTLSATDANGVVSMQFSLDGTTFSAPEPYTTIKAFDTLAGDGLKTVTVQFIDAAGNLSTPVASSITLNTSVISGQVIINGGALVSTSSAATLAISASSSVGTVTQMQFSWDGVTFTAPEPFAVTRSVNLATVPGNGLKTLYTRFINSAGTVSAPVVRSITLNLTFTGSVLINGGAATATSSAATLTLAASSSSGPVTQMQFSWDGVTYSAPEPFATTRTVNLATVPGNGLKTLSTRFIDSVGNVSAPVVSSITLNQTFTGSVLINGGAATTTQSAVTLTLSATSSAGPVTQMQFSWDGGAFTAPEAFATTRAATVPATNGLHTLSTRFIDSVGNVSAPVTSSITLNLTIAGTVVINGGATTATGSSATLAITASSPFGAVVQMQFSWDLGVTWTPLETFATTRIINLLSTPGNGLKTLYTRFKDSKNNVSAPAIASITLQDVTPPTGTIAFTTVNPTRANSGNLALTATDATGVPQMQFSHDGVTYTAFETFATTRSITLPIIGLNTIWVIFKDGVGNLSVPITASITRNP
jgi:hypothetical protein